jgi:TfoX/Sxy family transcriptional regulator of competence genes
MPYYSVPGEALNGWSEMAVWAEGAVEAACRGKKGKQGGKAER